MAFLRGPTPKPGDDPVKSGGPLEKGNLANPTPQAPDSGGAPANTTRRAFTLDRSTRAAAIALILLVAAVFMPQFNTPRAAYDYLVVFDITQSMNVEDYELDGLPVSRLTFAREAVRRTLRDLPCGSRVGWGVFAEYRTLVLLAPIEVCENYNDLLASLDRIDGRMRWGNASEISKGVFWAMRGARDVGGRPKVLFLTDGQEAPPVEGEGLAMFDDLKRGDISGWLVGVGGYTPRPIPRTDADGRPMGYWHADEVVQRDPDATTGRPTAVSHEQLSEVREPYLRKLAHQIGFEYMHLNAIDSVRSAMLTPRFAERRLAPTDFAWVAALVALLALLIGFGVRMPKRRSFRIPASNAGQ